MVYSHAQVTPHEARHLEIAKVRCHPDRASSLGTLQRIRLGEIEDEVLPPIIAT